MTTPSTPTSRNVLIHNETTFSTFHVLGEHSLTVDPPFTAKRGHYRVELDFDTRRATFTLIALLPEESA